MINRLLFIEIAFAKVSKKGYMLHYPSGVPRTLFRQSRFDKPKT